uniref:Uncharacterized protein n=1 Tax=Trichogramma kaykai TaxID=54128 RepID=A0ABD2XPD2_9HYME
MSAGLDLQAPSKISKPLQNTPMSAWLRSSQPPSPAMVMPPLSHREKLAAFTKRIVEAPRMVKDASIPSLQEFSNGGQGKEETCDPAAEILLLPHPDLLKRTTECFKAPSSQEAVAAASTPSSKRNKRPAASPPEVIAMEKRATGPHPHEHDVDGNNNAIRSEETFTVVKGRRGWRREALQAEEAERGPQPPRPW